LGSVLVPVRAVPGGTTPSGDRERRAPLHVPLIVVAPVGHARPFQGWSATPATSSTDAHAARFRGRVALPPISTDYAPLRVARAPAARVLIGRGSSPASTGGSCHKVQHPCRPCRDLMSIDAPFLPSLPVIPRSRPGGSQLGAVSGPNPFSRTGTSAGRSLSGLRSGALPSSLADRARRCDRHSAVWAVALT